MLENRLGKGFRTKQVVIKFVMVSNMAGRLS